MTYISYPGMAGVTNLGNASGLNGFWSGIKSVAKTAAQVAVLPVTASVKSVTATAQAVGLPGASKVDSVVSKTLPKPVNQAMNYVAEKVGDGACDALLNKYIAVGAAAGLAVATSGTSLLITQAGQTVATGACAKRLADEMAKKEAAAAAAAQAALAQQAQANSILLANQYPAGTLAYKQPDGLYRVAVPRGLAGPGLGATSHQEVAIVANPPPTAVAVDKTTYTKATKPFYLRTPFLVGVGIVSLLAVGGVTYAVKRK